MQLLSKLFPSAQPDENSCVAFNFKQMICSIREKKNSAQTAAKNKTKPKLQNYGIRCTHPSIVYVLGKMRNNSENVDVYIWNGSIHLFNVIFIFLCFQNKQVDWKHDLAKEWVWSRSISKFLHLCFFPLFLLLLCSFDSCSSQFNLL